MDKNKHNLINWGDLTYNKITQYFWGDFETYTSKYARNKTKVNFNYGNSSSLKICVGSRKKERQIILSRVHPKSMQVQKDIFSGNFGQP